MSEEMKEIPKSEFEQALGSLMPRTARLDRDRLMFLAGQAAVPLASGGRKPPVELNHLAGVVPSRQTRWAWPAAFSAMTAVAASLFVLLISRPAPQVIEKIVRVPVEVSKKAAAFAGPEQRDGAETQAAAFAQARGQAAAGDSYLRLRDRTLAFGLDFSMSSDPQPTGAIAEAPTSYRELRDSLLE